MEAKETQKELYVPEEDVVANVISDLEELSEETETSPYAQRDSFFFSGSC